MKYRGINENWFLKRVWKVINKAYFGSRFDSNMVVRFSRWPLRGRNAYFDSAVPEIVIDRRLRGNDRIVMWLLYHETNHMIPGNRDHGKKTFDKGMMRLARAGAFHNVW